MTRHIWCVFISDLFFLAIIKLYYHTNVSELTNFI